MGGCFSRDRAYTILRESIPGSLISQDKDFDDFWRLCKTEVHTISSMIHVNNGQAFYVVVSGEVLVSLIGPDDKAITVNTFRAGETINFFRCGTILAGSMISHELKLTLSFKSTEGIAVVIGADYDSIDYFFDCHSHCLSFKTLFDLCWSDFKHLPAFESLSMQQLNLLGPLMKIHITSPTEVLALATNAKQEVAENVDESEVQAIKSSMNPAHGVNAQVGLLLVGRALVIPQWLNLFQVIRELPTGSTIIEQQKNSSGKKSVWKNLREAVGFQETNDKYDPEDGEGEDVLSSEFISSLSLELKRETTQIFPGSVFGLENYFSKHGTIQLDSIIALETGIVGYVNCDTLKHLFRLDKKYKRILQRNFFRSLLGVVKPVVPMLCDMDDKKYSLLSCLVSMRCYQKDEVIFSKGNESYNCYIVLRGSIVEELEDSCRKLEFGSLFGEVSLITDTPYFTSTFAAEPTAVLCMDKFAFHRVYHNDKEKLAELRIKLLGPEIELQHILIHKLCNQAFADYLKKQMAFENIAFLNAVHKFEEILSQIQKEIWKVLGKRALRFFQVVAQDNYAFFDELNNAKNNNTAAGGTSGGTLSSTKKVNGQGNSMDFTAALNAMNMNAPGENAGVGGGGGGDNGNGGQNRGSFGTVSLSGSESNDEGHRSGPKNQNGLLRMSFGNVRATSFREVNHEMDKIAEVIKSGIQSGGSSRRPSMSNIAEEPAAFYQGIKALSKIDDDNKEGNEITSEEEENDDNHSSEVSDQWINQSDPDCIENGGNTGNRKTKNCAGWPVAQPKSHGNSSENPLTQQQLQLQQQELHSQQSRPPRLSISAASESSQNYFDYSDNFNMTNQNSRRIQEQSTNNPLSPLKDKPDRDIATLFQNYNQKFIQNIQELKEVARSIIEKHINLNSELEINIPQTMKRDTLERFSIVQKISVGRCLHELYDSIYNYHLNLQKRHMISNLPSLNYEESGIFMNPQSAMVSHQHSVVGIPITNTQSTTPMNIERQHFIQQMRSNSISRDLGNTSNDEFQNIVVEPYLTTLFNSPKNEIYKLLNEDSFRRWKQTPEFAMLLKQIEPYEGVEARDRLNTANSGTVIPATPGSQASNQDSERHSFTGERKNFYRSSSRLSFYVTSRSNISHHIPNNNNVNSTGESSPIPQGNHPAPLTHNNSLTNAGTQQRQQVLRTRTIKNNVVGIEG